MHEIDLKKTNTQFQDYSGHTAPAFGICELPILVKELICGDEFFVTQPKLQDVPVILGRTWQMRYNCYFNWCEKTVHCELKDRHIWVKLVRPDQTYGQQVLPLPPIKPKLQIASAPPPTNNLQQEDAKMQQTSPKQVSIPKITKRLAAGKEHWIWVSKAQAQTKSTTHTVALSKKKPPRTNQKFAAGKEQWVWKKKSEFKEQPTTHTTNYSKESNTKSSTQKMKWVRKDRHTQTEGRQAASPKAKQSE